MIYIIIISNNPRHSTITPQWTAWSPTKLTKCFGNESVSVNVSLYLGKKVDAYRNKRIRSKYEKIK